MMANRPEVYDIAVFEGLPVNSCFAWVGSGGLILCRDLKEICQFFANFIDSIFICPAFQGGVWFEIEIGL